MNINDWLEQFKSSWINHDIAAVLALFTDDVEYWESSFRFLKTKKDIESEWQAILRQHEIKLDYRVFSSTDDNKHSVIWDLSYAQDGKIRIVKGIYLLHLNHDGLCDFFMQTCETE